MVGLTHDIVTVVDVRDYAQQLLHWQPLFEGALRQHCALAQVLPAALSEFGMEAGTAIVTEHNEPAKMLANQRAHWVRTEGVL